DAHALQPVHDSKPVVWKASTIHAFQSAMARAGCECQSIQPQGASMTIEFTPATHMRSDPIAHEQGAQLLARLHGGHSGEQLVASLRSVCPDFATMTIEWAIAGIMSRPGLDLKV